MVEPPVDPPQFLKAFGAALSGDGRVAELQCARVDGRVVRLHFRPEEAGAMLLGIEGALAKVAAAHRKLLQGLDPRNVFPVTAKSVSRIQGGIASDGTPIVSLLLNDGLRLDFSLGRAPLSDLIAWLKSLETASRAGPGLRH